MKTKDKILKGMDHISNRIAVAKRALVYIGSSDCSSFAGPGAEALQYNVMAKSHVKYKSTVAYKHGF